jgi:membrane fusion protein (multidrug efflux system)
LLGAKAALVGAEANLELAEIDLRHTKVHAPITGKIGRRQVSKGDYIVPAAGLVRVVQQDPVRILFSVTDRDFVEFKNRADVRGDAEKIRARIVLPTGEDYPSPGIWDFFDNSMSPGTATLAVWMMAENKEGVLLPNTYVTVFVEGTAPAPAPAVDLAAVSRNLQGAYVYTVSASNTVEMARIRLGLQTDKLAAVESGLSVGDRVIVEGIQSIRPGMAVEVLE